MPANNSSSAADPALDQQQQQKKRQRKRDPRRVHVSHQSQEKCMGYYWLLLLRTDGLSSSPSFLKKMQWLDFLCQRNMGTKGLVSFHDEVARRSGCFCVLKTARTLQCMIDKLGHFCTPHKLSASFSSEHPLYLEYGRRGLLCMEQKGIPDVLVDMQVADRPPPIVLEGDYDDDVAVAGNPEKKSFACQVNLAVPVVQHPDAAEEELEQRQAAASLAEANGRMFALQRQLKEAREGWSREQRECERLRSQAKQVRRTISAFCTQAKFLLNEQDKKGLYRLVASSCFVDSYVDVKLLTEKVTAKADAGVRSVIKEVKKNQQQETQRKKSSSTLQVAKI